MANTHSLVLDSSLKECAFALDSIAFSITGDIAFGAWVKFSSLTGAQVIMSKDYGAVAKTSFNIYKGSSNKLCVSFSDNGTYDVGHYLPFTTDAAVFDTADKWYYVYFSFDISEETCIIGVGDTSTAPATVASSLAAGYTSMGPTLHDNDSEFVLGAWKQADGNYLYGLINNVILWAATRTQANFQTDHKTIVTSGTGLVGTWFVSETPNDQSTNGNNLTLYHGTGSTDPAYSTDVPFTVSGSSASSSSSASLSNSASGSSSGSLSNSASSSLSNSASASISNSASASASSSPYPTQVYTRGDYNTLPTDITDLEVTFTGPEQHNVKADDDIYVSQTATDEYAVFMFKNQNGNNTDQIDITWKGKSDIACTDSTTYLEIYNNNSAAWEAVANDSATAAGTEFTLTGHIETNVGYYYDASYWVMCRVYQEAK